MMLRSNAARHRLPGNLGLASPLSPRPRDWFGLSDRDVLALYQPGQTAPLQVLEVLIQLHNGQHTARTKSVSHKTWQERAMFLRRFFRDLKRRAGFKVLPDPRNLAQKHVQAMVKVWQQDKLRAPTIQTYLSFLRGLAQWLGKPGLIRRPAYYGLEVDEYQRTGIADHDKSWTAKGVDIDDLIERVCAFDRHAGASLRLIHAFGLRRKESVMLRPNNCIVDFEATGLPLERKEAERYIWIRQGAKGGRQRFLPLNSPKREAAIAFAQLVACWGTDAHVGSPHADLKQNLRHFDYVLRKFGISRAQLGITAHGLRHEALINEYVAQTGTQPTVRGGVPVTPEKDDAARTAVARLAGHERRRASAAYLGAVMPRLRGATRGRKEDDLLH